MEEQEEVLSLLIQRLLPPSMEESMLMVLLDLPTVTEEEQEDRCGFKWEALGVGLVPSPPMEETPTTQDLTALAAEV